MFFVTYEDPYSSYRDIKKFETIEEVKDCINNTKDLLKKYDRDCTLKDYNVYRVVETLDSDLLIE